MLLYFISAGFLMLFILSIMVSDDRLQPTAFALYGLTSMTMALVLNSNYTPIFIFRFFLYLVSGFIIIIIPILLTIIALLVLERLISPPMPSALRIFFSLIIGFTLMAFVGVTIWGMFNWNYERIQGIIAIYSLLALYITSTFLCYIMLNYIVDIWPCSKQTKIIVILGSRLDDPTDVPEVLKRRLNRGIEIYRRQKKRTQAEITFIVTGGPPNHSAYSEAEGMKAYLISKGVPPEVILVEPQAQNTYENFINVNKIIHLQGLTGRKVLITSRFHLIRSLFIARQAQFKAHFEGSGTPVYLWPFSIVREYLAYLILTRELNYAFIVLLIIQGLYDILWKRGV